MITNIKETVKGLLTERVQDILEDYELDYGNGEVCFYFDNKTPRFYFVIEAPNHTTIVFEPYKVNKMIVDFFEENENGCELSLIEEFVNNVEKVLLQDTVDELENFDIDETFEEIWHREFEIKPSRFIEMLSEDKKHFENVANKMRNAI